MQNKSLILIAAIIAFIIWLLSRKKGNGSGMTFPASGGDQKLPGDKPLIGGGGTFGGGGASGSWLTETAQTINPGTPKPTPAIASPMQLVDKAAITEKVSYQKPVIEPLTPSPSVISPIPNISIKPDTVKPVMPVQPISMGQSVVAPVAPVSPVIPKPVFPAPVPAPVITAPIVPAPIVPARPVVVAPVVPAPIVPAPNRNGGLLAFNDPLRVQALL